jgi:hypothetical protein
MEPERLASELGVLTRELALRALGEARADEAAVEEARRRAQRRDAGRVPGSTHFASMLAYGDFVLTEGGGIRCEAIPGISGVATSSDVHTLESGQPRVELRRILTHFHFDEPPVMIEQHYGRASTGTLTGASSESLLPGRATFSQYLILTLAGRPLANREPLVMTADRVEEWPPIGSTFVSEGPAAFYDVDAVSDLEAAAVARLEYCKTVIVSDLGPVLPRDHQRGMVR